MMAFASPLVWWAVAAAVAGIGALHLLSWRRPRPRLLPTARFLPAATQPSRFRRLEPSDLSVLAIRVLAILAIGAAAVGPLLRWRVGGVARVVVVDRSRAVADPREHISVLDSLATGVAELRVIAFDTVARTTTPDGLRADTTVGGRGHLGAALIVAARAVADAHARFDSVEVAVVSPLVEEEVDAALGRIVATTRGPVTFRRLRAAAPAPRATPPGSALPSIDDAVGASVRVAWGGVPAHLRLSRASLTAADSAFARDGGATVVWPIVAAPDSAVDAITVDGVSAVAPVSRVAGDLLSGTPRARFADGTPAASEEPHGAGCIRHVAIGLPVRGDAVLRPAFTAVVRALTAPCASPRLAPVDAAVLRADGDGPRAAGVMRPDPMLQRALLALALIALGVEWWMRRRRAVGVTGNAASRPRREAA
ncbi:MAG: hypothetical protein IT361_14065 [Gemmatimonadaceae bacterium]|nr:hypothetical protein [Gemmatimonadaceae bacterium]